LPDYRVETTLEREGAGRARMEFRHDYTIRGCKARLFHWVASRRIATESRATLNAMKQAIEASASPRPPAKNGSAEPRWIRVREAGPPIDVQPGLHSKGPRLRHGSCDSCNIAAEFGAPSFGRSNGGRVPSIWSHYDQPGGELAMRDIDRLLPLGFSGWMLKPSQRVRRGALLTCLCIALIASETLRASDHEHLKSS
jgi:hypothetical protein